MPHGILVAEIGKTVAQHAWPVLAVEHRVALYTSEDISHGPWGWCEPEECGRFHPWRGYENTLPCFRRYVYDPETLSELVGETLETWQVIITQPDEPPERGRAALEWCWHFSANWKRQRVDARSDRVRDLLNHVPVMPILLSGFFGESPSTALVSTSEEQISAARVVAETAGGRIKEFW